MWGNKLVFDRNFIEDVQDLNGNCSCCACLCVKEQEVSLNGKVTVTNHSVNLCESYKYIDPLNCNN